MNKNSLSINFAKGWDYFEGNFSIKIANNILLYCESKDKKIKNALDICCGTGNYIQTLENRSLKCFGTETESNFIRYCKNQIKNPNIKLVRNVFEIPFKETFDLISCNHSVINSLNNFEEWKILLKNVFKHLSNKGVFVFDFDTKFKLSNINETIFKSLKNGDMVFQAKTQQHEKCTLSYLYYIKENDYMTKIKDVIIESYYDNNLIINELKKIGFKNITTLTENFEPVTNLENLEKIVIIASKK